ncbi:hypothetical protein EGW08_002995, partial [Elysia chlorotica]
TRLRPDAFNFTWPVQEQSSVVEGDIVLGALHMIHERSHDFVCGKVMEQGGIQALEAMLYTLDHVNGQGSAPQLIPGVTLGILAKDDCDTDILGLEQALEFIRGSITNIGESTYKCKDGSTPENLVKVKVISGVLGAPSSQTSIQVANLLKLFRIPQISFFSTSAALSSRERFPYFLRTIPSDVYQAEAIIALVNFFGWKYVSIVYEESSYGMSGYNELENLIGQHDICFGAREKLMKDSGVARDQDYEAVVTNLLKKNLARGVIVFASDQEVAGLMRAVRRMGATGRFAWIGSDGWGGRGLAYNGNEQEVEGAVTVLPQAEEVQGFKKYFLALRPDMNERNPWFTEYWEQYFQCRYPGSRQTPFNGAYNATCTGEERIPRDKFSMEAQLQFVSDSVLAFAYAFKEIHQNLCGGRPGVCPAMAAMNGEMIRAQLLKVHFTGLSGQKFQFLPNGDGPSRYQILNYRRTETGEYEWATVGYYRHGLLKITKGVQFRSSEIKHPPSMCKRKCSRRQAIDIDTVEPCCSSCKDCQKYQYRPEPTRCEECPMGTLPSYNMSLCLEIPQIYLSFTDATALVALTFSSLGILAVTLTGLVFLRYANTPVVKASGRELSFVLLLGIFLCYTMTFLLITKPSKLVCGAQTIGIGFCFSVCYSAILTKTNRIARIFRAGERTTRQVCGFMRPKFISPESQLVICASLVACQIIISLLWLLTSPPKAVPFYANRDDHQLVCEASIGFAHMVGFSYPILLVLVCTVYAIITRKIPEAFNESKHIGFTMYTTCIIWAAFVVIYLSTAHNIQVRLATMCFSISLSATVALLCMFTPKLYIILFRPERNVRQSMMAQKTAQYGAKLIVTNSSCSSLRVDSGTQSEDFELIQQLQSSCSLNSLNCATPGSTLTYRHIRSSSTQTLDMTGGPPQGNNQHPQEQQLWEEDDVHL